MHGGAFDAVRTALSALGAIAGHAIVPGLGGALGGAAVTHLLDRAASHQREKKKVFVSFDFDNDRALKEALVAQARLDRSPFEVFDHSLREAKPENEWKRHASHAIKQCDLVVVILGEQTHAATGVKAEVAMARKHGVPCIQLYGQKQAGCRPVARAGRVVRWTWDDLDRMLG